MSYLDYIINQLGGMNGHPDDYLPPGHPPEKPYPPYPQPQPPVIPEPPEYTPPLHYQPGLWEPPAQLPYQPTVPAPAITPPDNHLQGHLPYEPWYPESSMGIDWNYNPAYSGGRNDPLQTYQETIRQGGNTFPDPPLPPPPPPPGNGGGNGGGVIVDPPEPTTPAAPSVNWYIDRSTGEFIQAPIDLLNGANWGNQNTGSYDDPSHRAIAQYNPETNQFYSGVFERWIDYDNGSPFYQYL